MKLADYLKIEAVEPDLHGSTRDAVLTELAAPLAQGLPLSRAQVTRELRSREEIASTALEHGVAVPHCKVADLHNMVVCFGLSRAGVQFGAADGSPTHFFMALLSPLDARGLHLKLLARISTLLRQDSLRADLLQAHDAQEIHRRLLAADALREAEVASATRPGIP